MDTKKPEALAQECADYATSLRSTINVVKLEGRTAPISFLRAADLFERAAARIAELETLRTGYNAARLEIESLQARVQELGQQARECSDRKVVKLDARIKELEAQLDAACQAIPVAWRIDSGVTPGRYITFDEHPGSAYPNAQPLYTAPQHPAEAYACQECAGTGTVAGGQAHFACSGCAAPARQQLTVEQIKDFYGDNNNFDLTRPYVIAFARAVEAAHGITAAQKEGSHDR